MYATGVKVVYDTTDPSAAIADEPTGRSNVDTVTATVSGTGVARYKYKILQGATCTTGGYPTGAGTPVSTDISENISVLNDGNVTLCVIGQDTAGNWQGESAATSATWFRDTVPPTVVLF